MAVQKGRDVLVRIREDNAPDGFVSVAGIRARSIKLAARLVDATNNDSPQAWRELLAGAGSKFVDVAGSGVFCDAASDVRLRSVFFNQDAETFELVIPDFGVLSGPFMIQDLAYTGDHDSEARFSITLKSAGEIGFSTL